MRRAHQAEPSIELLDIHNPETSAKKEELSVLRTTLKARFFELRDIGGRARELAAVVENTQDGLEATRTKLAELSGTEHAAKRSNDIARIEAWRSRLASNIEDWIEEAPDTFGPEVPGPPAFETADSDLAEHIPTTLVDAAIDTYQQRHAELVTNLRETISKELQSRTETLNSLKLDAEASLKSEGFEAGSELLEAITALRNRALELEDQAAELKDLDRQLLIGNQELSDGVERLEIVRSELRDLRKSTCVLVNQSMRSVAAKLRLNAFTTHLDDLVEDLKTGTRLQHGSRAELRDALDRKRVLSRALAWQRGDLTGYLEVEAQDQVVDEAASRGKWEGLADLAGLWPGDGLDLLHLGSTPPVPFSELTEGLRALAIKEISFAASPVPVVTDQPEDAVPTRAVFEVLVPTLRSQRISRQFIVVSHDANIVVAGDIDKVMVLKAQPSDPLVEGTLFDEAIRDAALEHLEGGATAFRHRSVRYATE